MTDPKQLGKPMLSPLQVAEFVGVSVATVRRWLRRGELKHHYAGSQIRVYPDDLRAFIQACHV